MGTATVTRSKSRIGRANHKTDSPERDLLSPLTCLPGNVVYSFPRRGTRRTASGQKSVDQENVPTSTSRATDGKRLVELSPQKVSKKRKPAEKGAERPGNSDVITAGQTIFGRPPRIEGSLSRPVPDIELAENLASCDAPLPVKVLSDNEVGDQTELQPRILNVKNSSQEIVKGSMQQSAATGSTDNQQEDVLGKSKTKDGGVETDLSSSSALMLLQKEYGRLFLRYKKLKAQRLDEADALYNEQNSRISDFVQATEALLEFYKGETLSLKEQLASNSEILDRCRVLEEVNVDCKNELLQEQSRGLKFEEENQRLKSLLLEHIADKQKQAITEPVQGQGSQSGNSKEFTKDVSNDCVLHGNIKLMQRLLECLLGLQIICSDVGQLRFQHCATGFCFDVKEVHDKEMAEIVEGGELMYQNVSVGVCRKAVPWMKEEEVIFGMNQAQILFKRLVGFLNRGFC